VAPINKINWSADSIEAKEVLDGAVPMSMASEAPFTMKILRYIAEREKLPEIDTYITPNQVSEGFKKWKEETSTSPSGCHLGLRRIPAYATGSKELEKIRTDIQQVQADIINFPISGGFSPNRWKTIVMLENHSSINYALYIYSKLTITWRSRSFSVGDSWQIARNTMFWGTVKMAFGKADQLYARFYKTRSCTTTTNARE
jgi:hypothetical protein